jgi:molecular chaperone GrpE (heat shock protein)
MSSSSIGRGKTKYEEVIEDLHKLIDRHIAGAEPDGEEIDQDDIETDQGEQEATETINTPKKKSKRRRPKKKNKGKPKGTGCEADEGNTEHEEVEDEFQLTDEFPFKERIAAMPEEQRRAKLQELQEFIENLRDKARRDEQKVKMQIIKDLVKDMDMWNKAAGTEA